MMNEENYLREVDGKYVFREGETFDTYEELLERLNVHSKESLVYYWRRDSRTVERAFTRTSRQIASKLKYYVVRFACIYGGMKIRNDRDTTNYNQNSSSKSLGKRTNHHSIQQTTRTNCPAYIQLRASKCGQKLEVISVCNSHNHEISERISQTLPHNRKLTGAVRDEVNELLHLKIDRKKIMEYVKQREGKIITSKDLLNMATRLMKQKDSNQQSSDSLTEIKKRLTILRNINGFVVDRSLKSIINREIIACESELSILYSIDTNHLIEYILPEHEFGVNETAIDSIVEATRNEINGRSMFNANNDNQRDDEIDVIDTIAIGDDDDDLTSNLLNFNDLIVEDGDEDFSADAKNDEEGNLIEEDNIIVDDGNLNDTGIKYESPSSTVIYDELMMNQSIEVKHEDFGNYTIMLADEIQNGAGNYIVTSSSALSQNNDDDYGDGGEKTNEDVCTKRKNEIPNKLNRVKNSKMIRKEAQNSRKRIIRCKKCGIHAKLLQMQINYLKKKVEKLNEQTNVLKLTKLKLKLEIQQLKSSLL